MLVIINATTFIPVIFTNPDICMVWENIRDAPIPIPVLGIDTSVEYSYS